MEQNPPSLSECIRVAGDFFFVQSAGAAAYFVKFDKFGYFFMLAE